MGDRVSTTGDDDLSLSTHMDSLFVHHQKCVSLFTYSLETGGHTPDVWILSINGILMNTHIKEDNPQIQHVKKNGMTQSRYNMCPLKERYSLSTHIWIPLSFMTLYRVPFLSALPFSHGGLRLFT